MIENGWVLDVDRAYAHHVGADSWLEKIEPGDSDIDNFIADKDLYVKLGAYITGEFDLHSIIRELVIKVWTDKEAYDFICDNCADTFEQYMQERAEAERYERV